MRFVVAAVLLVVLAAPVRGDQCVLDPDGNGQTTIGELITAVNQALVGCEPVSQPTPTPTVVPGTGCQVDFSDNVAPAAACLYRGIATSTCPGGSSGTVLGTWYSVGLGQVFASLSDASGVLGIFATRTSATTAVVTQIAPGPNFIPRVPASGMLLLTSPTGFMIEVMPQTQSCSVSFDGVFEPLAK